MTLVDTHCHLNFDRYAADRADVIARAAAAGVTRIVNPAIDLATSHEVLKLADRFESVYAAVGIHPNSTSPYTARSASADLETLRRLAEHPKVVAIGEIGLDYYRDRAPKATQRALFEAQLALAAELGLPVIIHNREADEDVLAVLEAWQPKLLDPLSKRPGVLHSFSASFNIAQSALAINFMIGITGPITFKKADALRQVAARIPVERLLVETDGPFLTPHPYRGKRNEPAYVRYVADRLAEVHGLSFDELSEQTTNNARALFKWQF